jgi:hypothetical protein
MKPLTNVLALFALFSNSQFALAQTINPPEQEIPLAGSPFAVTTTPDSKYVFASLSGAANGIAVIKQERTSATLVRVLATGGGTYGLIVTPDGRYLLDTVQPLGSATSPQGVRFWVLFRQERALGRLRSVCLTTHALSSSPTKTTKP